MTLARASQSLRALTPAFCRGGAAPRRQARRSRPGLLGAGAAALVLTLAVTGCPSNRSPLPGPSTQQGAPSPGGPDAAATVVAPRGVAQVLDTPGTPEGRATLAVWARASTVPPELRLAALRRLEEVRADETASVAADLAATRDPLLRQNAVAALVRLNTQAARAALAGLDPDAQGLARDLAARGLGGGS